MRFRGRAKAGAHRAGGAPRRGSSAQAPSSASAPTPASAPASGAAPGQDGDWPTPALVIDALGRKCPIPIILLAERIREIPVGEVVAVLADDVAARTDVPAWCRMKSQDFVREETLHHPHAPADAPPRGWAFHIRRMY